MQKGWSGEISKYVPLLRSESLGLGVQVSIMLCLLWKMPKMVLQKKIQKDIRDLSDWSGSNTRPQF